MSVLTFQPGPSTGKDVRLIATLPTQNYGGSPILLSAHTDRALLEFDLSSLAVEAICNSATLSLYLAGTSGAPVAFTITAYRVAVGNEGWVAGDGQGHTAFVPWPSWNARQGNGVDGAFVPWAGGPGLGVAGVDYVTPALGSCVGNGGDALGTEYTIALPAATVQGWFGSPNTNYGLLLVLASEGTFPPIAASNESVAARRPKLVVNYTHRLSASKGSYLLGGVAAGHSEASLLSALTGDYALTGAEAPLLHQRRLSVVGGLYLSDLSFPSVPQTPPERVFKVGREHRIYLVD